MKIKIDAELIKGDYVVEVFVDGESTEEFLESVKRFSNPIVNFGGAFTETVVDEVNNTESSVELYKFNDNMRELPTDLPYTRTFKKSQYGVNTEKFALAYVNEMYTRIENAKQELLNKVDNFSNKDKEIQF